MKLPDDIPVYGDRAYRGECPRETLEQVTVFRRLHDRYPGLAAVAIHPRNEGKRTGQQTNREKAEGMNVGAPDLIIPGAPAFVCEIKRRDHTKSTWQDSQQDYLRAAIERGCFVCVALGADAVMQAIEDWQ